MRTHYVFRDGKWVDREQLGSREIGPKVHVIQDSAEPFTNPFTGKLTDSKGQVRRQARAMGLVEVGNERLEQRHSREDSRELKQLIIEQVNSRWR